MGAIGLGATITLMNETVLSRRRELLGLRETDKKVNKKSCDELIEEVVRLLEKYIIE